MQIETLLPPEELNTLNLIISANVGAPYETVIKCMINVFENKITPLHYIALGIMIGQRVSAYEIHVKFLNLMQPCQRLN